MNAFGVQGECDPAFARVREAFVRNFEERGEVGAAVAIHHRGRPVVDLWGGVADPEANIPWERDTLVCMMSVAKGVSATLIHILAGREIVDLDQPIALYWPEFAEAGKREILVRWALSHLAGLPVVDGPPRGAIYDWAAMTRGLERQPPSFAPGTTRCYHTATMGFILGEIMRRTEGRSLGAFLREEVAEPFGVDYAIGLPDGHGRKVARMIPSRGNVLNLAQANSDSPIGKAWAQLPTDEDFNSPAWRKAEIPSANGHGTARGVATFYGILALGGSLDGKTLIEPDALQHGIAEQWRGEELLTGMTFRMGLGYFLNCPPARPMGPSLETFGHSGAGGAPSFADPRLQIGFCYAPNRMHGGLDIGPRAEALIEAAFASL